MTKGLCIYIYLRTDDFVCFMYGHTADSQFTVDCGLWLHLRMYVYSAACVYKLTDGHYEHIYKLSWLVASAAAYNL